MKLLLTSAGVTKRSIADALSYSSPTAGTGQATSASWDVEDIEQVVSDLKSKGVSFENYEIPGAEKQGEIVVMGGMKAAWFKDPSGNILAVGSVA